MDAPAEAVERRTKMTHKLKLNEAFADAVLSGNKSFEIRRNDRGFQKGDFITFQVVTGPAELPVYVYHELNRRAYKITYVLSGWGLQEGYVALGIKEIDWSDLPTIEGGS